MPDLIPVSKWHNSMHFVLLPKRLLKKRQQIKLKIKSELEKAPQADGIPKLNRVCMHKNVNLEDCMVWYSMKWSSMPCHTRPFYTIF